MLVNKEYLRISNFFVMMNTRKNLLHFELKKMPEGIDKFLMQRKFQHVDKALGELELEFNLIRYLVNNLPGDAKIKIDKKKYFILASNLAKEIDF